MSFDVRTRLSQLKASAKKRNINVNLDVDKYQAIIDTGCYFCGDNLKNEGGYCLDRIDNTKGYSIQNVVPCCKICNRAKSDMDVFAFADWVQRAAKKIQKEIEFQQMLENAGVSLQHFDELSDKWMESKLDSNREKERLKIVNGNVK